MGRLAKVMQGQSQPGLKAYKSGGSCATPMAAAKKAKPMPMMAKKVGGKACKK